MNKPLFLLLLCFSLGLAQAAPIEDEPLPFDTRMPPRLAVPLPPEAAAERAAQAPVATRTCKTVVRKVKGRKVRKEVCSKPSARERKKASSRSKASSRKKAVVSRKSTVQSRKRR